MKPCIGITLDWQESGTFSKRPHYALRQHYFDVISAAGGLPIGIPNDPDNIDEYLNRVDGLVIPGGFFASPASWYVGENEESPYEASPRLQFDLDIIEKALDRDMPILGICAGMQLMAGLLGCKMTPDVMKYLNSDIDHINAAPAEEVAHPVFVVKNSLLHSIVKIDRYHVNTAHREAIVEISDKVVVNATAPDGAIEGIEVAGARFALGVQWHPEFFSDKGDKSFALFEALVAEAEIK